MPNKKEISDFAMDCYNHESGRRKAIDEGIMTMEEFSIYHYINAWTNRNISYYEGLQGVAFEFAYNETFQKAFRVATKVYNINEATARKIHDKVRRIPKK